MLNEPVFELFCVEPIYELTTVEKELRASMKEANILTESQTQLWPDVDFLFGEDESYQLIISDIMRSISASLTKISNYGENYKVYCEMVESILKLEIEKSIKQETFSPNDFHYLLQTHNEFVCFS